MKFSIIVPTFNRSRFLDTLINSIISQSYKNWELIIVDDHSTDNTEIILSKYRSNSKIFFLKRVSNIKGACSCRNEGLEFSSGEFVIFLDSDDMLFENSLMNRFEKIRGLKYDFIVSSGVVSKPNEGLKFKWNVPNSIGYLDRFLQLDSPWSTNGPTFRRDWLINNGIRWDINLNIWQDVDFHLQVLLTSKNYLVDWDSDPDYQVCVNEQDSISRVDYFNKTKIKAQYYFLKKYENLFKGQLNVVYFTVFEGLVKTRQYLLTYYLLKQYNTFNLKYFLKFAFWINAVLSFSSLNRLNINDIIRRYQPKNSIGKSQYYEY